MEIFSLSRPRSYLVYCLFLGVFLQKFQEIFDFGALYSLCTVCVQSSVL